MGHGPIVIPTSFPLSLFDPSLLGAAVLGVLWESLLAFSPFSSRLCRAISESLDDWSKRAARGRELPGAQDHG